MVVLEFLQLLLQHLLSLNQFVLLLIDRIHIFRQKEVVVVGRQKSSLQISSRGVDVSL